MALLRIEPMLDIESGLYFLEIYYPEGSARPFVTTEPRYMTAAAAETDAIATISANASIPGAPEIAK
ncbi:hypothetical protein [Actibacterium sp. D379-3]